MGSEGVLVEMFACDELLRGHLDVAKLFDEHENSLNETDGWCKMDT